MELITKNGENGSSANNEEFHLSIQNLIIKKGELAVVIGKIGISFRRKKKNNSK